MVRIVEFKLDGRIDNEFLDRKTAERREEQRECLERIREHRDGNQTYNLLIFLRKM
jgi:hypothetical protein